MSNGNASTYKSLSNFSHTSDLQMIFVSNAYLPSNFDSMLTFKFQVVFSLPIFFFTMLKRERITVLKCCMLQFGCHFEYSFSSDLVLLAVLHCKNMFVKKHFIAQRKPLAIC